MGAGGTDVARESAALVLLDNAFSSIVGAVKMGRRIFDNIKKAMAYILAIHIPIAGMSLIPILLDLPMAFLPVHIVFLELVIDPSCSVAFEQEAAEKNTMKRPPRCTTEPLFNKGMIMVGISQGIFILGMVLALFWFSHWRGQTDDETRAMAFTALIIANLSLILTNRSWSTSFLSTIGIPNKAMWIVVSATLVFLGLVLYVPFLQDLFKFASLAPFDLLACLGAGIVSVIWFEILKICREMHRKSKGLC
jgi:Ca2+-transporting ATPase